MATAVVTKWGNGQGIRLPKLILDEMGVRTGDVVDIMLQADSILITKAVTVPRTLADLFEGYSGDYQPTEWDIGEAQGKEMW